LERHDHQYAQVATITKSQNPHINRTDWITQEVLTKPSCLETPIAR
jgi:hypothetical protein